MGPDGEIGATSVKLPCIPLRLVMVIVELTLVPALAVKVETVAVTLKSWMCNGNVTEWDSCPFVPVIVTV